MLCSAPIALLSAVEYETNNDTIDRLTAMSPNIIGIKPNAPRRPPPASALRCAACRAYRPYATRRIEIRASVRWVLRSTARSFVFGCQSLNPNITSQISPGITISSENKPKNKLSGRSAMATAMCAAPSKRKKVRLLCVIPRSFLAIADRQPSPGSKPKGFKNLVNVLFMNIYKPICCLSAKSWIR